MKNNNHKGRSPDYSGSLSTQRINYQYVNLGILWVFFVFFVVKYSY